MRCGAQLAALVSFGARVLRVALLSGATLEKTHLERAIALPAHCDASRDGGPQSIPHKSLSYSFSSASSPTIVDVLAAQPPSAEGLEDAFAALSSPKSFLGGHLVARKRFDGVAAHSSSSTAAAAAAQPARRASSSWLAGDRDTQLAEDASLKSLWSAATAGSPRGDPRVRQDTLRR